MLVRGRSTAFGVSNAMPSAVDLFLATNFFEKERIPSWLTTYKF